MAEASGTIAGRALALLGVALLGALVHSWLVEVEIAIPEPTRRSAVAGPREPVVAPGGAEAVGEDASGEAQERAVAADPPGEQQARAAEAEPPERPGFRPLDLSRFDPDALGSRLSLHEAEALHRLMRQGEFVFFFDAREAPGQYERGHIAGALHVTAGKIDRMDEQTTQLLQGYLTPDMRIVIYCGGGDCDESDNVRRRLYQMGFGLTHVFEDGFPAWRDAGLAVVAGPEPDA